MTRWDALCLAARALAAKAIPDADRAQWRGLAGADWQLLLSVTTEERIATALCTALERHGVLGEVPEELRETLLVLRELARERNEIVVAQARHAFAALNGAGVRPVLLKGIAHLLTGLHADAGNRLVGDLDLLVPRAAFPIALEALEGAGYAVHAPDLLHEDGSSRVDIHHPPLQHAEWPLLVELHWALLPPPHEADLPLDGVFARATVHAEGYATLAAEDAFCYNVLHAEARHHRGFRGGLHLWQLWDSVLLARRLGEAPAVPGDALSAHGAVIGAIFGMAQVPGWLCGQLGIVAGWRVRAHTNGTARARLDTALRRALLAIGSEWANLRRQWADPRRRRALVWKALRPGSYVRRARNLIARVHGEAVPHEPPAS